MMKLIKYRFVKIIPDTIKSNTLYISIEYNTAIHLCPCGCKNEIVTPLSPYDWSLIFDGNSISLHPSIGNWNLPCQSHYWIEDNKIIKARKWSPEEISENRNIDRQIKEAYFKNKNKRQQ